MEWGCLKGWSHSKRSEESPSLITRYFTPFSMTKSAFKQPRIAATMPIWNPKAMLSGIPTTLYKTKLHPGFCHKPALYI